jgi:hypothetical protein
MLFQLLLGYYIVIMLLNFCSIMLLNLLWLHYVGVVVIVVVEVECDLMANYFLSCVQNKFRFFNPRNERKKEFWII